MTRIRSILLVTAAVLAAAATTTARAGALPNDPMEPIASAAGANAGPLAGAILVTRDPDTLRRAYVDGLGLAMRGPLALPPRTRAAWTRLWRLPAGLDWQAFVLERPAVPDSIRVLVMVPAVDTPRIRASYAREETGPYALGFPMRDVRAVDARMVGLGFVRTLPEVNVYPLQLRDGTPYAVTEASYEIADATRLVLLNRGNGLPQTGGIDAATGLGGPAYSSLIVEDVAAMERFFTGVFDYERRTSREWTVFSPRFRYVTLHARGARTGNLGLVEYAAADRIAGTGVAPRPPNRGLAGWSIPVRRLAPVVAKARAEGRLIAGPVTLEDPRFGRVRVASLLAPNGMLVEAFERR